MDLASLLPRWLYVAYACFIWLYMPYCSYYAVAKHLWFLKDGPNPWLSIVYVLILFLYRRNRVISRLNTFCLLLPYLALIHCLVIAPILFRLLLSHFGWLVLAIIIFLMGHYHLWSFMAELMASIPLFGHGIQFSITSLHAGNRYSHYHGTWFYHQLICWNLVILLPAHIV